jgi:predicted nucleotidyltransferase component of viral defense system
MTNAEGNMLELHEDRDRFGEALSFTEAELRFPARLVEKDYYCTVLLEYLAGKVTGLVFKGGTCLAKVHTHFFRLSEDLDFVIPVTEDTSRTERRELVSPVKVSFIGLARALPCFQIKAPLKGANNSTQYVGSVSYQSVGTGQGETIKIEVALREPLLTQPIAADAQTALLDPLTGHAIIAPVSLLCISKMEAFAEKFRAALSRREVAVRDFFDLDYAVLRLGLRPEDAELIRLVRRKLAVSGNEPVDVSANRLAALRQQVEPKLQPVLRAQDFAEFDLERAFQIMATMAARVT